MIRSNQNCYSKSDKELYPFDEVIMFWTDGGTVDSGGVMMRSLSAVSSVEAIVNRSEIFLHSIEFAGYDTAETHLEKADDAEKEYASEIVVGNMLTSSWQPNYCRPLVRINGTNVLSSISSYSSNDAGVGGSIGLPLPFCLTLNKVVKEPRNIEVLGALAQKTKDGFRNYPLLAIINFWHNFS